MKKQPSGSSVKNGKSGTSFVAVGFFVIVGVLILLFLGRAAFGSSGTSSEKQVVRTCTKLRTGTTEAVCMADPSCTYFEKGNVDPKVGKQVSENVCTDRLFYQDGFAIKNGSKMLCSSVFDKKVCMENGGVCQWLDTACVNRQN